LQDFNDNNVTFFIEGAVSLSNQSDCPYPIPDLPPALGDIQIDIALARLRCALFLAYKGKLIDRVVHQELDNMNITFNKRMPLQIYYNVQRCWA
jgi:hypothetical protein